MITNLNQNISLLKVMNKDPSYNKGLYFGIEAAEVVPRIKGLSKNESVAKRYKRARHSYEHRRMVKR